jgi:hypothetical protein
MMEWEEKANMNTRERILAIGVLAILVVVGGFFLVQAVFLGPLQKKSESIALLLDQIDKKTARVEEIQAELPKLERWRALSLPSDVDVSRVAYEKWLTNLLQEQGFSGVTVTPKPTDFKTGVIATGAAANKAPPVFAKLFYSVTARASLANLVRLLDKFYSAGLLHQIRTLSIQRPLTQTALQQRTDLDINLSIEALSLTGADPGKLLLPPIDNRMLAVATAAAWRQGPVGLAFVPDALGPRGVWGPGKLAPTDRDYNEIAKKDIFIGRTGTIAYRDVDPNRFYKLTDISENEEPRGTVIKKVKQANLYDVYNNRKSRLQAESNSGYQTFTTREENNNVSFKGKVVKINKRDLIFQGAEESPFGSGSYFRIKVGGTMAEALRKPLPKEELVNEGLVKADAPGAKPAPQGAEDDGDERE